MIFFRQDSIEFAQILILVSRAAKDADVCPWRSGSRCIGQRDITLYKVGGCGIEQIERNTSYSCNCAVGGCVCSLDRRLGSWQVGNHLRLSKVSDALKACRDNGSGELLSDGLSQTTVAEEEESFVPFDWTADGGAEVISMKRCLLAAYRGAPRRVVHIGIAKNSNTEP